MFNDFPGSAVTLTKKLISIDSSNPGAYEYKIAEYIKDWLSFYNIPYESMEVLDKRENIKAGFKSGSNLPPLIYICHMDTVVIGQDWTKNPFEAIEENGLIYGRGSCDMKSGLACALSSLLYLKNIIKNEPAALNRDFYVILSVDEEDFMRGVEKALEASWVYKDCLVLDTEPTDNRIQVAHKGRIWLELDVYGKTAHASMTEQGIDAILAISYIITKLKELIELCPAHHELGKTSITFGQINGGYRPYVVPDHAKLWIDIRNTPPTDSDKITEFLEKSISYAKSMLPGFNAEYIFTGNRPFIERNDNSFLLQKLKQAADKITSEDTEISFFTGYTDTAVIAGKTGNINCMSYGPGSLCMAHKPDEYVPIADIIRCEKVLSELLFDLVIKNQF